MGIIAIEGMEFKSRIGYYQKEQIMGNKLVVDVYIETDIEKAMKSDKIEQTINYEDIHALAKQELKQKVNLLEHVVYNLHQSIIKRFPAIKSIKIRIAKLSPPIDGIVKKVYVEADKIY